MIQRFFFLRLRIMRNKQRHIAPTECTDTCQLYFSNCQNNKYVKRPGVRNEVLCSGSRTKDGKSNVFLARVVGQYKDWSG